MAAKSPLAAVTARFNIGSVAPFIALALLCVLGVVVNPRFLGLENITNVLARSTFIATIAVGQTWSSSAAGSTCRSARWRRSSPGWRSCF